MLGNSATIVENNLGQMMKHFLTLADFTPDELMEMLALGLELKRDFKQGKSRNELSGKVLGMIFEKNSTRTRVSFEAGIYQLGGMGMFLSSRDIQLSRGESIHDSARVISSMLDLIMIRTFEHSGLEEFAKYSKVPVINGLSDSYHPVQVMADYMTMIENGIFSSHFSNSRLASILKDLGIKHKMEPKLSYIGDGNNMTHSYMMLAAKFGLELKISTPKGYEADSAITELALKIAKISGAKIEFCSSPKEAISNCNVVLTDTWTSMGQESEKEKRKADFKGYCIDSDLMALASKDAIFMHCLPAYRGQEVSADIIDGPQSRVFEEAENRLHVQKGIMLWLHQNR